MASPRKSKELSLYEKLTLVDPYSEVSVLLGSITTRESAANLNFFFPPGSEIKHETTLT